MFDGANEEYLKLTYKIPSFPYIFMLKEDTMYPYLGSRDEASIVEFVTSYYNKSETKERIPPTLTYIGLQYIYMERKFPAWNETLNKYIFTPIGYDHLPITTKLTIFSEVICIIVALHLLYLLKICVVDK
jgi:hypothetical protein